MQTVSNLDYGATVDAETLAQLSKKAESQSSDKLFIGWYTGENGSGSMFDETTRIYQDNLTLYPYYEEQGKGFYVLPIGDQIYTGSAIKPAIQVYDSVAYEDGGTELIPLVLNRDYTVSYRNNKNVNASDSKNIPTVTVKGKGNYSGTQSVTFNIVPKSLTDGDITAVDITAAYSGKTIKSTPQLLRDGKKLAARTDYTVSYPQTGAGAYQTAGTYPILVTGKGGYTGTITVYETITKAVLMSKISIIKIPNQTYESNRVVSIEPPVTVKYKNTELTESTDGGKTGDYTVTYENNTAIGTATATITAVEGSGYIGSKSVTYKIVGTSITKAKVTGLVNKEYTGYEADVKQSGYALTIGDKTLTESKDEGKTGDYTVSYDNISKAGTAKVVFQGINAYTGKLTKTYKITAYNIAAEDGGSAPKITMAYYLQGETAEQARTIQFLSEITTPYVKGGSKPVVVLFFNGTELTCGKDYTVKYANNNAVTTATIADNKLPKLTITGKGSFKGSISGTWKITDGQLSDETKLTMTAKDVAYKDKKGNYKTTVTLTDISGSKLAAGRDYEKILIYIYVNNTEVKDADGNTVTRKAGETASETDIVPAGAELRVTATGMGAYAGAEEGNAMLSRTYRVVEADISKATVKMTGKTQPYLNGRAVTLKATDLSVTFNGAAESLVEGVDYEIDEKTYTNNRNKGKATVVIRGIGKYGGEKKVTYTIGAKSILWWKN
jgi:hypothetical protein